MGTAPAIPISFQPSPGRHAHRPDPEFRERVEGINNKIKVLKRKAYGYRDMEYFKLRIYFLNEARYTLLG